MIQFNLVKLTVAEFLHFPLCVIQQPSHFTAGTAVLLDSLHNVLLQFTKPLTQTRCLTLIMVNLEQVYDFFMCVVRHLYALHLLHG